MKRVTWNVWTQNNPFDVKLLWIGEQFICFFIYKSDHRYFDTFLIMKWSPFSYHLTLSQSFNLLLPTEFSVSVADFQMRKTAFSLVFLKFCDYYIKMSSCYFKPLKYEIICYPMSHSHNKLEWTFKNYFTYTNITWLFRYL